MEPDHLHTTPSVVPSDPNIMVKAKSQFAEGYFSNPPFSELTGQICICLYMEVYICLSICTSNLL